VLLEQLDGLVQVALLVAVVLGDAVGVERRERADVGVEGEGGLAKLGVGRARAVAQRRRDRAGDGGGVLREIDAEEQHLLAGAGAAVVAGVPADQRLGGLPVVGEAPLLDGELVVKGGDTPPGPLLEPLGLAAAHPHQGELGPGGGALVQRDDGGRLAAARQGHRADHRRQKAHPMR